MPARITRADLQGMERRAIEALRDGELERFKTETRRDIGFSAGFGHTYMNIFITSWVTLGKALMMRRNINNSDVLQEDELIILINTCLQTLTEMYEDVDITVMDRDRQPYICVNWS